MITFAQVIAALLGVLCGSIMIAILIYVPIFLKKRSLNNNSQNTNNDIMPHELIHSGAAIIITFIFASLLIFICFLIAADILVWFSITMLAWYLAGFAVYAVQKIAKERKSLGK